MSGEGDQGFIIRDRRGRGEKETEPAAETAPHEAGPPVTFASFVFSLGTSALMLMGEQLDPQQAHMPVNLPQAKEIIDILSMLEDKTKGNLGPEERSVLTDMLYALRMKYVALVPGKQTSQAS